MEIAYIKIEGQEQYKQLARALKDAGRGDLQRKLVRNIRREGTPAMRAAQSRFRSVDVRVIDPPGPGGGASTGLRARVAAATRISVLGSGISVRVEPKQVDPRYGKTLTYGIDGLGRWRHPVYGNRKGPWVQQTGQEVFFATLTKYESKWRAAVVEAMEEIAAQIGG